MPTNQQLILQKIKELHKLIIKEKALMNYKIINIMVDNLHNHFLQQTNIVVAYPENIEYLGYIILNQDYFYSLFKKQKKYYIYIRYGIYKFFSTDIINFQTELNTNKIIETTVAQEHIDYIKNYKKPIPKPVKTIFNNCIATLKSTILESNSYCWDIKFFRLKNKKIIIRTYSQITITEFFEKYYDKNESYARLEPELEKELRMIYIAQKV